MPKRSEIVAAARDWIGTPYRHQGRTRAGVDCIGFVWAVAADLGYHVDIPNNYSSNPSGDQLIKGCERTLVRSERVQLIAGDIAILWGYTRGLPQHFAIMGSHGPRLTMIHAWSKHAKVVEHGWDEFWAKRLVAIYELPGTVEG